MPGNFESKLNGARVSIVILLDSDVVIDLLRRYSPAVQWFDALEEDEELALPGYVVMELIQGCRNRAEQEHLLHVLAPSACAFCV